MLLQEFWFELNHKEFIKLNFNLYYKDLSMGLYQITKVIHKYLNFKKLYFLLLEYSQ